MAQEVTPDSQLLITLLHLQATEDKNNAIAQAEKTATKAKLADRLINGLSGENKRWNETIAKFGVAEGMVKVGLCTVTLLHDRSQDTLRLRQVKNSNRVQSLSSVSARLHLTGIVGCTVKPYPLAFSNKHGVCCRQAGW